MKQISVEDLHNSYKALGKDELILDVRTPEEFQSGHVPGSRNIPHDSVSLHAPELKQYKMVYVYCRSGGRVQFACHELSLLGVTNLSAVTRGGMPDWEGAGFPIER
jgi:rhodanese-related sulfurtransferase